MIVEELVAGYGRQLLGYGKFAGSGQAIDENELHWTSLQRDQICLNIHNKNAGPRGPASLFF
jgi:hypothetical protein